MKFMLKLKLALVVMCIVNLVTAQNNETITVEKPLDGIVAKNIVMEKQILDYPPLREADIMWERRVWRVIDIREKMNLPFAYPKRTFFEIIFDAAASGGIRAYSVEDDQFSYRLEDTEIQNIGARLDTVYSMNPETLIEELIVVKNDINYEDVKRFRVKEIWYFDTRTSTMNVRILGIAPLIDQHDDNGNFRYERPLFWVYYPECREMLAKEQVFNPGNDASPISWEDLMERRFFSSYVYKASNVRDQRLEDHLSGVNLLLESEKINQEILNFEHDLWTY